VRLRYTEPALEDLQEVLAYIADRAPQAALRVQARLRSLIELLPDHPSIGVRTSDKAIRCITATPYPYLVFYEVTPTEVIIHAIRHGARDR